MIGTGKFGNEFIEKQLGVVLGKSLLIQRGLRWKLSEKPPEDTGDLYHTTCEASFEWLPFCFALMASL